MPFRECKITHLFMNHLTGVSVGKTVMILNVNPSKVRRTAPAAPQTEQGYVADRFCLLVS